MAKQVVVISGGLDSSTLLADVATSHAYREIHAISFDYGQRHKKELEFAARQADTWGASHDVIDITSITEFLMQDMGSDSSLLNPQVDVPQGHYAAENMKATVVPNRNMIMSSIAVGHAVAINAEAVWLGVHAGDHFIYPDCRPRFFSALNAAAVIGNEEFGSIPKQPDGVMPMEFIKTPYINLSKNDIAELAVELDVDISETWSCYEGGEMHCGRCGTCVERQEAIASVEGFEDPTPYIDNKFWIETLEKANN